MQSVDLGGRGSAAYDLRTFQSNSARRKKPVLEVRKPTRDAVARERARRKVQMVLNAVVLAAVVVAVVVAMLCSSVELTELNTQISAQKAELEAVTRQNTRLQAQVEAKLSARNVEEYATQKLGMAPLEKSQISYIKLNDGDAVEMTGKIPKGGGLLEQIEMAIVTAKAYIFND